MVEHLLAKEKVVGSNPIFRSISFVDWGDGRPGERRYPISKLGAVLLYLTSYRRTGVLPSKVDG